MQNVDGQFTFRMQSDNNLVVYDGEKQVAWHIGTYFSDDDYHPSHLDIDNDRNFCLREPMNKVVWTSHLTQLFDKSGKEHKICLFSTKDNSFPLRCTASLI